MQRDFVEPGGFGARIGQRGPPFDRRSSRLSRRCSARSASRDSPWFTPRSATSPIWPTARRPSGPAVTGSCGSATTDRWAAFLIDGEPGNDFVAALQPLDGEVVIAKPGKGAFYATDLQERLAQRGITHLFITGVTTEVCVQTTMREANDRGYECLLVEDATESYFPALQAGHAGNGPRARRRSSVGPRRAKKSSRRSKPDEIQRRPVGRHVLIGIVLREIGRLSGPHSGGATCPTARPPCRDRLPRRRQRSSHSAT